MTDRDVNLIARRRQLEADLAAKAAQLLAVPHDQDGPLWTAEPEAPQEAPQEAAPVSRLPAPNPAQGSSGSGAATLSLEPTAADKAQQLARLQNNQRN